MYQISQTSFINPDTADQPWQSTALYTAHSADYRGITRQCCNSWRLIFRTAYKLTPTLGAKTAQTFSTYTQNTRLNKWDPTSYERYNRISAITMSVITSVQCICCNFLACSQNAQYSSVHWKIFTMPDGEDYECHCLASFAKCSTHINSSIQFSTCQ